MPPKFPKIFRRPPEIVDDIATTCKIIGKRSRTFQDAEITITRPQGSKYLSRFIFVEILPAHMWRSPLKVTNIMLKVARTLKPIHWTKGFVEFRPLQRWEKNQSSYA